MSTIAIVAVCVTGSLGYFASATYVYMRLLWYFKQKDGYADHEDAAFFCSALLPVGLCLLAIYSRGGTDDNGLPPRSVRNERKIKEQQAEIERLERELDIR